MTRKHTSAAARIGALAMLVTGAAFADGELGSLLRTTLEAIRDGHPNLSQMEPMTADAVQQQNGAVQPVLQRMGAIQSVAYKGMQSMPGGSGEAYAVTFKNGRMLWVISESAAGKIQILWTSGPQFAEGGNGR